MNSNALQTTRCQVRSQCRFGSINNKKYLLISKYGVCFYVLLPKTCHLGNHKLLVIAVSEGKVMDVTAMHRFKYPLVYLFL